MSNIEDLKFYAVRNNEAKYFRRKGYHGWGETWTDDLAKIRIWTKLSHARACVTYFANAYPQFPLPELVEIAVGKVTILDETARVEKAKKKKLEHRASQEARNKKRALEITQRELEAVQAKLKKLKGDD